MMVIGATLSVASCATISESQCQAGNWSDLGYRDGLQGVNRTRIIDYVEKCGEFGAPVNREQYLNSYEAGLEHYCTYEKGVSRGRNGYSYNTVCEGPKAEGFRIGYDEGYAEYKLHEKYKHFEKDIDRKDDELTDVTSRLAGEGLEDKERRRLSKKKRRLEREIDDLIYEFRHFRQEYNLDW
jgi:hypothetical protein